MCRALEKHKKCDRSPPEEITHGGGGQAGLWGVEQKEEIMCIYRVLMVQGDHTRGCWDRTLTPKGSHV